MYIIHDNHIKRFFYIFGGSGLLCGRSRCTAVGPRLALKLNIDSMTSLPGSLLEFQMFIEMPVVTYKEGLVQEFVLTTVKTVKTFLVDFSSSCLLKRFLFIMQLHFLPNKFLSGLSWHGENLFTVKLRVLTCLV